MSRVIMRSSNEWHTGLTEAAALQLPDQLFAVGRELPPYEDCLAVVGTRRPTGAGREAARLIASGLAQAGFAVVSGLAIGIDAIAHEAALEAGGHTIAVLGCGLDRDYPKRNATLKSRIAERGTVLTEYAEGTEPRPYHFPERNRIIAALCRGVVVIEGAQRSGALITARYALDISREVYAVPGSIRNPAAVGPNELIRSGRSHLVTCVSDIFEDIAPGLVWQDAQLPIGSPPALDDMEAAVLLQMDDGRNPMARLTSEVKGTPGQIALALSRLEVRGLIAKRPTGYELSDGGVRARAALNFA